MIQFIDLHTEYEKIRAEIEPAVRGVLERCQYALDPEVEAFEHEFASYGGAKYGIGIDSGTSALHMALRATGVGPCADPEVRQTADPRPHVWRR